MNTTTSTPIPQVNHHFSLRSMALRKNRFSFHPLPALIAAAGLALAAAAPVQAALVGHWTFDNPDNPWEESSGYRPAGTHDGAPIGAAAWSPEGHAGTLTGGSLDLTAGNCGLRVMNTSLFLDPDYQTTFDDDLANAMTIAFWAKNLPDTWCPWVSKGGEMDGGGYQVRRAGSENFATFTIRGTPGDDDPWGGTVNSSGNSWHHYAAVWDGVNGTRQLYVDGVLSISITDDYGPFGIANNLYLAFGARDWDGASGGNFVAFAKCKMDDVRIYDSALTAEDVTALAVQESGTVILYPQFMETFPGQKTTFSVILAPQALQTNGLTVWITNSNPGSVTLPGAVGKVLSLTFAKGSTNVQSFQAVSAAAGTANLTCGASDGALANVATLLVDAPQPSALVGLWTFNDPDHPYAETSGYRPAGTHDGEPKDPVATSIDIPPGTTGYSLDLTQGGSLRIANSKSGDPAYRPSFDDLLNSRMTIALWVKINQKMGDWDPFVIKNGEGAGFQVRLNGGSDQGCFTVRGTDGGGDDGGGVTINDGQWHHIAAVRDGLTGLRLLYVDGYPDQSSVRPTSDTGLMQLASTDPLFFGTGENGRQFSGYLKDVRIYNYPLTRAQVQSLIPTVPTPMVGHWTFDTQAPLADTSGYQPAGTHDLLPVGPVGFSNEVPPGRTGQSLDLMAGNCAVIVSNSNQRLGGSAGPEPYEANPTWQNTFDIGLSVQMSIAFWAKGFPDASKPWISKNGEGYGYQVRRFSGDNFAAFTLDGTPGNDDVSGSINVNNASWHHYAAVWDGISGTRQLYVDGIPDPGVNTTGDFGPNVNIAAWEYLVFGGRDSGGVGNFTPCLLNDVRIYRVALSQAEVQALLPVDPFPKIACRNTGANGLRISWPARYGGFRLQKSASLLGAWNDAGLSVTLEAGENAAYAPISASAQFFRLGQ